MLAHLSYAAWVTCEGKELSEYEVTLDKRKNRVTCWIPSQAGKTFTVHWRDMGSSVESATYLYLDGTVVPGHFLFGSGTAERGSMRVGEAEERPFMFATVQEDTEGTPSKKNASKHVGTIMIKIRQVRRTSPHAPNAPRVPPRSPRGRRTTGETYIGFGPIRSSHPQATNTWSIVPYDDKKPGSYVTFVFRYRPRDFLVMQGIMSRSDPEFIAASPSTPALTTASTSPSPGPTPSPKRSKPQAPTRSLYSDFSRQKHSNPTSYTSNVEWWRRTLEAIVLAGWQAQSQPSNPDRLVLHADRVTLPESFRYEGVGKPLSLATVIVSTRSEALSTSPAVCFIMTAYYSLSEFLSSSKSIYDPGWLPYRIASFVVGKPLWWALEQMSLVDSEDISSSSDRERWKKIQGDYVVLSLLERAADSVIQHQREKFSGLLADQLYNPEGFKKEFAGRALEGVVLSDLDVKVLLRYLERDKRVLVIKFVDPDGAAGNEVTPIDTGVLELKTGVERLQAAVDSLQYKIDERTQQITVALGQKRQEIALSYLRAKKQLEDVRKKRLSSLDMLQSTLLRVEESAGDIEIMRSYESSTATLRAILAHPLLQREKIDETMDAMGSANTDAQEVDDAIRLGGQMAQADANIDEAELEEELQALVRESEAEQAEKARAEHERQEEEDSHAVPCQWGSPSDSDAHTPRRLR
ncbi:hypothetical protein OBBRIDRAFT_818381 [Obba rivulosa]|uniref:DUF7918 domain-containing protein n=1 Tax=Obba rivulosa TaxID=1052685 RepID=A0A8E2DN72_9APHY|nr:hypothetical protein OBBRIDRAFT_818381 [Obba rivulosa]